MVEIGQNPCLKQKNARKKDLTIFHTHFQGIVSWKDVGKSQSVLLVGPGSVLVDYVLLQPGPWGRFHDLPVRKDVAEAMFQTSGWQVLRLGGWSLGHGDQGLTACDPSKNWRPLYIFSCCIVRVWCFTSTCWVMAKQSSFC